MADDHDFLWTTIPEPHRSRHKAIVQAHPEVLKLCGHEPKTKYLVSAVVLLQSFLAWHLSSTPFFSLKFFLIAYAVGAVANQFLFLAIHELSHNLGFRTAILNRYFSIFANLPIGLPYSASFRGYHLSHHRALGVDGIDADLPTAFEARLLNSTPGKLFFCTFQLLFYAIRPMFVYRETFTIIHVMNIVAQLLFNTFLVYNTSWNALFYLFLSSLFAGSLHPVAAHFIAEHYYFGHVTEEQKNPENEIPIQETFSYYGSGNILTLRVGLHNEHHDFSAIPWTRLPKLRETAAEFYDHLPHHDSWIYALYQFITDKNVGMYSRVKRKTAGRRVGET